MKSKSIAMLSKIFCFMACVGIFYTVDAQALRIPQNTNFKSTAGRSLGGTEIEVKWSAPGVKGREGKIWGTDIAYFGTQVLGFGSDTHSPWRAGADECTTISFSTDVEINGAPIKAGIYAFFIEVQNDKSTLIFNSNANSWGSYFYNKDLDVLRVETTQQKNMPEMVERLDFRFSNQSSDKITLSLLWEHWSIPMEITINAKDNILSFIQKEMTGELAFDPPSLISAANWCLQNDVNLNQALQWADMATNPYLGAQRNFQTLRLKSLILAKLGKSAEAKVEMEEALNAASSIELHQHGRSLLQQGNIDEAYTIFLKNYEVSQGKWPSTVGMMRIMNAKGDYKKALQYAQESLSMAPDDLNRKSLKEAIEQLKLGKPLAN